MTQELSEIPNLNRHQIPGVKQSFVSEKAVIFVCERTYCPCLNFSFEISLALLRGKAGLFYLTSAVLPEDFGKRFSFYFRCCGDKKTVLAAEGVEVVEFSLMQRRTQEEGKLRLNLDFKERGTFPSSTVINNDSCKGIPCLAV